MDSEKLRATIVDFLRGSLTGATTDTLGAPVDIINSVVKAVAPASASSKPYGGSAHLRELLRQPAEPSSIAEIAGGLASPAGAMKAALLAIKLSPAELKYFNELTQDMSGSVVRKLTDVPKDYDMPSTAHFEGDKLRLSTKQFDELQEWMLEAIRLKDVGESKLPPSFYRGDFPRSRKITGK